MSDVGRFTRKLSFALSIYFRKNLACSRKSDKANALDLSRPLRMINLASEKLYAGRFTSRRRGKRESGESGRRWTSA
jgi:hypothetical protein